MADFFPSVPVRVVLAVSTESYPASVQTVVDTRLTTAILPSFQMHRGTATRDRVCIGLEDLLAEWVKTEFQMWELSESTFNGNFQWKLSMRTLI